MNSVESQFDFLKDIDLLMHTLLVSAEASYYSKPAHTLVQMRKFEESIVNSLARANRILGLNNNFKSNILNMIAMSILIFKIRVFNDV